MFFKKFIVGVLLCVGLSVNVFGSNGINSLAIADTEYIPKKVGSLNLSLSLLMAKASAIVYDLECPQ